MLYIIYFKENYVINPFAKKKKKNVAHAIWKRLVRFPLTSTCKQQTIYLICNRWEMRVVRDLSVPDADSLSPVRECFRVCSELRYNRGTPGWYTTLWALARYAGTKRLNEHLRTPRQSRVNRTWLILSRKICGGRLPRARADSYFSSPIFFSPPPFS